VALCGAARFVTDGNSCRKQRQTYRLGWRNGRLFEELTWQILFYLHSIQKTLYFGITVPSACIITFIIT